MISLVVTIGVDGIPLFFPPILNFYLHGRNHFTIFLHRFFLFPSLKHATSFLIYIYLQHISMYIGTYFTDRGVVAGLIGVNNRIMSYN